MTGREKVSAIKYSINNIINRVYGVCVGGIGSRIINVGYVQIAGNDKYVQHIVKTLTDIDPAYNYHMIDITDLYNKLLEIKDYSDEELKLYFKMR